MLFLSSIGLMSRPLLSTSNLYSSSLKILYEKDGGATRAVWQATNGNKAWWTVRASDQAPEQGMRQLIGSRALWLGDGRK